MIKTTLFASLFALVFSLPSHAECYGSGSYKTCYDNSGNTYDVQKIGNSTYLNGRNSNTGSTWSQDSTTIGNTTYQNGRASNGNSWSGTSTTIGNTTYHNGTDSNGNYYNKTCNQYGCN